MKAIILSRQPDAPITNPGQIIITPGSAILMAGRGPLFLPDWCDRWMASTSVALRVCRLGRSIEERFASRYFDAVAAAMIVRPVESTMNESLQAAFDGALALGKWIPIPSEPLSLESDGLQTSFDQSYFPAIISLISKYMTLQQGDVIIPAIPPLWAPLKPDRRASATINSETSLDLKIK